jgi:hypothetical protein
MSTAGSSRGNPMIRPVNMIFLMSRARAPPSFPAFILKGGIDTRTIGRSCDWPNGFLDDIYFIADDPNERPATDWNGTRSLWASRNTRLVRALHIVYVVHTDFSLSLHWYRHWNCINLKETCSMYLLVYGYMYSVHFSVTWFSCTHNNNIVLHNRQGMLFTTRTCINDAWYG